MAEEDPGLTTPEVHTVEGHLPSCAPFQTKEIVNKDLETVAAVTEWGKTYSWQEWGTVVAHAFGINFDPEANGAFNGFDHYSRTSPDLTPTFQEAQQAEIEALLHNVQTVLTLNGWKPESVGGIILGGEPLMIDGRLVNPARIVADHFGITGAITQTHAYACNSGAMALVSALTHPDLQGKNAIVIGHGAITKSAINIDPKGSDVFSAGVFADCTVGMGIIPGVTMTHIDSMTVIEPDLVAADDRRRGRFGMSDETEGYLCVNLDYQHHFDISSGAEWVQDLGGGIIATRLPQTGEHTNITMIPAGTGLMFTNNTADLFLEFYAGKLDRIKHWAFHHPSLGVIQNLSRKIQNKGRKVDPAFGDINLESLWDYTAGGNASAPMALRHLATNVLTCANPGERVGIVSMGAGASYTLAEIGLGKQG